MKEENKKKYNRIIIVVLILVAVFFIYWNNFRKIDDNKVMAVVGNEKIIYSDLKEALGQNQQFNSMSEEQILDQLINIKIAKIYADSQGYFDDPKYKEEFKWQKEEAKKGILASIYLEKRAENKIKIDDEFYNDYTKQNPYYKIMTIFKSISNSDSAKIKKSMNKAYEKLLNGNQFSEVREEYMDEKYLDSNNKEEIIEAEIVKSLVPRELKVGEFTQPLYTENGYYIIKRLPDPKINEIKEKLGNDIKMRRENSYMRNYADSLKLNVLIYDNNLSNVVKSDQIFNSNTVISKLGKYKMEAGYFKKFLENSFPQIQVDTENMDYIKNIAKELTLQNYLYKLAQKQGIEETPDYKNKSKSELAMFDQGWENFIIGKVYNKIISEETKVTEVEIENYYNSHPEEFTEDGSVKPLKSVRYNIKYNLQEKKINSWFDKVKNELDIKVER